MNETTDNSGEGVDGSTVNNDPWEATASPVDETTTGTATDTSTKKTKEGPKVLKDLKVSFRNLGESSKKFGGTALKKTLEITARGMNKKKSSVSQGQEQKTEIICVTKEEALLQLQALVETAKLDKDNNNDARLLKWNFATLPLECFEATLDDVLRAFCEWSRFEKDDTTMYNVTMAFERLEQYATWMDKTNRDMVDPPLTPDSIRDAWKAWAMKVSYDKIGRFVLWIDLEAMDMVKIKKELTAVDNLRLFVWLAHYCMFDSHAQQHGILICKNLNHASFWSSVTLIPTNLVIKIDRLTIGTLPVKMKKIYVIQSPKWIKRMMGMVKPFMSAKMKTRIVTMENPTLLEEELGTDCLPSDFGGCHGTMEHDLLWDIFVAK